MRVLSQGPIVYKNHFIFLTPSLESKLAVSVAVDFGEPKRRRQIDPRKWPLLQQLRAEPQKQLIGLGI